MSQRNVEKVIGLLATDESLRHRFVTDPEDTLASLLQEGLELNPCEIDALRSINPRVLARFAEAIDPRLQKSDLKRGPR